MNGPRIGDAHTGERVRQLLALEINRILEDLEARRGFLVRQWGAHRQRWPFLDTVHSRWSTLGLPELAHLDVQLTMQVDAFYQKLEELRLYFRFTDDMPYHLGEHYDKVLVTLKERGELAIEALGGVPDYPLGFEDAPDDDIWDMSIEVPEQPEAPSPPSHEDGA